MSRAAAAPKRSILPWNGHKTTTAAKVLVAEPLTEEQARAELRGSTVPASPPALQKPAPSVQDAASRQPKSESSTAADRASSVGRLNISMSTATCVAVAGFVCVVMLGSYSVGRRYSGVPNTLPPAAAVTQRSTPASTSPLLPIAVEEQNSKKSNQTSVRPDLSFLLQPPGKTALTVAPNKPARVMPESNDKPVGVAENLFYLQIESFRISRDRNGDQLLKDVEAVRKYLASQGVDTIARRRSNGFVLFGKEGFSLAKDQAQNREAFRKKIERLGQEYRRSGGLYQFKGCLFVNFATTKAGDPVAASSGE
jgi:hypothetical protein